MANLLIAEDDANIRTLLEMVLSADGHNLTFAADGHEALSFLKDHTPDLIFLDVSMPNMDGLEVCTRLKQISRFKETPVVILTALGDRETVAAAKSAGADLMLNKPLSGLSLRDTVKELLGEKRSDARA